MRDGIRYCGEKVHDDNDRGKWYHSKNAIKWHVNDLQKDCKQALKDVEVHHRDSKFAYLTAKTRMVLRSPVGLLVKLTD